MTINGEGREALEASAYEVPVNTMQPVWSKTANENHESFEATYALPDYPTNEALDKTTISYAQLLEQVSFNSSVFMRERDKHNSYVCACMFVVYIIRTKKRTYMAMWRCIFNQPQGRMNSTPK